MVGELDKGESAISAVRSAWSILAHGAPVAAEALVDIAENGKSEMARTMAAQAVLDRVGIAPKAELNIRVTPDFDSATTQLSPAEVIRNRLKALAAPPQVDDGQLPSDDAEQHGWEAGVIDAELVPTEDEEWT